MDAEYLIVDESCERKVVEDICTVFPDVKRTIFSQALIVEAVNLGNLS